MKNVKRIVPHTQKTILFFHIIIYAIITMSSLPSKL